MIALLKAEPTSININKLFNKITTYAKSNWIDRTTQSSSWTLISLSQYFSTLEQEKPNYKISLWINQKFTGTANIKDYTANINTLRVPLSDFFKEASSIDNGVGAGSLVPSSSLLLSKEGPGCFYYRFSLQVVPLIANFPAFSNGFSIERSFSSVDKGNARGAKVTL